MNDTEKEIIEPENLTQQEHDLIEISTLADMVQSAVEPFADSQKIVARETTKQTEIIAKEKTKMFWGLCFLATLVLVLAGIALFLDKEQITEKVIIAIVSFMGGLGFGKKSSKSA